MLKEEDIKILLRFRMLSRDSYKPSYWVLFQAEGHLDACFMERRIPKKADILRWKEASLRNGVRKADWRNCLDRKRALDNLREDAIARGLRENACALLDAHLAAEAL
jgi:hypothetical protein